LRSLRKDFSLSALIAGFIAVMVSYAGPLAVVIEAARAAHMSDGQVSSWLWAISIGSGITGVLLSIYTRTPVIIAWSTPGAALLITALPNYVYPEAVGAYVACALLITIFGVTGLFSSLISKIPAGIVGAMLAGILFKFGAGVFTAIKDWPGLVVPLVVSFYCAKKWLPRYAVVVTLVLGVLLCWGGGKLDLSTLRPSIAVPVLTMPKFSLEALIGLGLPLFLVTMTSQNATGLGVMKAAGYQARGNLLVTSTGIASLLLAPFGCHAINLAAITAAICTGPESNQDPDRRYVAGIACGGFYILIGLFGLTVASAFAALPGSLVSTIAGLALLGALMTGLSTAMGDERTREGALVTFIITASGVSFYGIGAPFWGLVGGMLVHGLLALRLRAAAEKSLGAAPRKLMPSAQK